MNSMYLYLAARSVPEKQLVEAECLALAGGLPDELGVVLTGTETDVSRAAYIKSCVRVILDAADLEDLYAQLGKLGLDSEEFRVSVVKLPRRLPIDSQQVMHQVGARIGGKPNLSDPKTVFVVVATERKFWLGELMSEATGSWNEHSQKAHLYSSALPTRFARAMVNLVASPGDTIIDPCCGSGTILIEAASIGIRVAGADNNPKMVTATIENLEHFGLSGLVNPWFRAQYRKMSD